MNKKGFIDFDEIRPEFLGLALLGSLICVIMLNMAEGDTFKVSMALKVIAPILTFVACYLYLVITDN